MGFSIKAFKILSKTLFNYLALSTMGELSSTISKGLVDKVLKAWSNPSCTMSQFMRKISLESVVKTLLQMAQILGLIYSLYLL